MRGFGNDAGAAASDRLLSGTAAPAPIPRAITSMQEHRLEAKNREIEPEAVWQRSGDGEGGVEVAFLASGNIGLRDARNPDGPALIFTPGEWRAFVAGAKDGEFNRPGAQPH